MIFLVGVEGLKIVRGVVRLAANEATEEGSDDGLGNDDLVVNWSPFKIEQLHAYWLCLKDVAEVVGVDSIPVDEPLEDVEMLWSELATAFLEEIRQRIGGVLDETGVHKRWHMGSTISRVMGKVVVVVAMTREGSLGPGLRFDWENLSDGRF